MVKLSKTKKLSKNNKKLYKTKLKKGGSNNNKEFTNLGVKYLFGHEKYNSNNNNNHLENKRINSLMKNLFELEKPNNKKNTAFKLEKHKEKYNKFKNKYQEVTALLKNNTQQFSQNDIKYGEELKNTYEKKMLNAEKKMLNAQNNLLAFSKDNHTEESLKLYISKYIDFPYLVNGIVKIRIFKDENYSNEIKKLDIYSELIINFIKQHKNGHPNILSLPTYNDENVDLFSEFIFNVGSMFTNIKNLDYDENLLSRLLDIVKELINYIKFHNDYYSSILSESDKSYILGNIIRINNYKILELIPPFILSGLSRYNLEQAMLNIYPIISEKLNKYKKYNEKYFIDNSEKIFKYIINKLNNQENINKLFPEPDNSPGESDNSNQLTMLRKTIIKGMDSTRYDYHDKRSKEQFFKMLSILTKNEILFNTIFDSYMITKFKTVFKSDIDLFDDLNYHKNAALAISLSNKIPQELVKVFSSGKVKPNNIKYIYNILKAFDKIKKKNN